MAMSAPAACASVTLSIATSTTASALSTPATALSGLKVAQPATRNELAITAAISVFTIVILLRLPLQRNLLSHDLSCPECIGLVVVLRSYTPLIFSRLYNISLPSNSTGFQTFGLAYCGWRFTATRLGLELGPDNVCNRQVARLASGHKNTAPPTIKLSLRG